MRHVIDSLRAEVEETVEEMLGKTWFLSQPTPARMQKWRQSAQEKAILAAGFSLSGVWPSEAGWCGR